MMFPKPRKLHKKYSQKLADKYFSLLIRLRGYCAAKGLDSIQCGGSLQCAHVVTRANKRLRYDERAALCLCAGHHRYYTTHADEWYWDFLPKYFAGQFHYVQRHRNETVRNNSGRLREIIDALDQQLTALQVPH
jgi:hypothetical protein